MVGIWRMEPAHDMFHFEEREGFYYIEVGIPKDELSYAQIRAISNRLLSSALWLSLAPDAMYDSSFLRARTTIPTGDIDGLEGWRASNSYKEIESILDVWVGDVAFFEGR